MTLMKIVRILLAPFGLFYRLYFIALDGARDLHNKVRFLRSKVDRGCSITSETKIQPNCHILSESLLINSTISSYSYIGKKCIVQNTTLGSFCSIANEVLIGLGKHPDDLFSTSTLFYRMDNTLRIKLMDTDYDFKEYLPVEIGNDVWIGTRAIILDGVKIGHGAIVAASAVVTHDIPPYAIVGGVPAKVIRYRFSPDKIERLLSSKWWDWSLKDIKRRIDELNHL
jgi:chloramphenicol O-acetyltransferase type B